MDNPLMYKPVLAKIKYKDSSWYEVLVYKDRWFSWFGHNTFNNGEIVTSWKYCDEVLNE